ncbi:LOW QUALITY PROTEIN: hypothetical protein YC2023_088691 [Brassica napus]
MPIKINDEKAQTNLAKQNLCVVVTVVNIVENNTLRNDGMIQELTPPFVPTDFGHRFLSLKTADSQRASELERQIRRSKITFPKSRVPSYVRVRHLIVKSEAEIYPQWPEDKVDDDLHNLITDILHGELDDTYWNQNTRNAPVANKAKRKLASECEACVKKKMPKERTSDYACGSGLRSDGDDGFKHDLMEAVKTLTSSVASMDKIVAEKVLTAVDTTIEAKVNARVGQAELVLAKQISTLKEDVAILREQMQAIAPKNDAQFVNQEDEVNSNDSCFASPTSISISVQSI